MFFKKIILLLVITLAYANTSVSQCLTINLIKNPGLEEYSCCPKDISMIDCAQFWTQPDIYASSSDYYNICGIDSLISPSLLIFFKYNYFGDGYAGIHCSNTIPGEPNGYREYIQGEISEPLIKDKCYYGEFWVRPFVWYNGSFSCSAIDALGIHFSDTLPKSATATPFLFNAQINNPTGRIISDTNRWTKVSGSFIAKGGEKYLTVGSFTPQYDINVFFYEYLSPNYAYYFFDNFSLCPCEDTIPPKGHENVVYIPNIFSPNSDGNNDILYVRGENIKELTISIYNRWGEKVFESNDITKGWDGNYKGKPCPVEVYVYYVNVTFSNGITEQKNGNITLVR